jgi:hypothetical protein
MESSGEGWLLRRTVRPLSTFYRRRNCEHGEEVASQKIDSSDAPGQAKFVTSLFSVAAWGNAPEGLSRVK